MDGPSKSEVMGRSERSYDGLKVDSPNESKDKSGRSINVKVDGSRILKIDTSNGRPRNIKVDGPNI